MLHCILDNVKRQMTLNEGLKNIDKNKKIGDDDIFETHIRFSTPADVRNFQEDKIAGGQSQQ